MSNLDCYLMIVVSKNSAIFMTTTFLCVFIDVIYEVDASELTLVL